MGVRFPSVVGQPPIEAARMEWLLQGTQQSQFAMKTVSGAEALPHQLARITTPSSGTIIALDPDIPPHRQRVSFTADGLNVRWLMDGKAFAKGTAAQWAPWPGRHLVQLTGVNGEMLDEIRLEVRGAAVRRTESTHFSPMRPVK
jgi:penicillin-binding protein 1C